MILLKITKMFHKCFKHYKVIILHKFGFVNYFLKLTSDFCNIGVIKSYDSTGFYAYIMYKVANEKLKKYKKV